MTDQRLNLLVRPIDSARFAAEVHGPGYRIVYSMQRGAVPYQPRWLGLLQGRSERHYFVKRLGVPLTIDQWAFSWTEGTSAVRLDFQATFSIQADDLEQACKLVAALHDENGLEAALRRYVDAGLHQAMERMYQLCEANNDNVLAKFRTTSIGVGESPELNEQVSCAVGAALGGLPFRIGFQLVNAPPMQVEIKREDSYVLVDSAQPRTVMTSVLLELANYQVYKKAGLRDSAAVKETIGIAIEQAVKRFLFAKKYYDVVKSFASPTDSIEKTMSRYIAEEAAKIGYRVSLFQSYIGISALKLLNSLRIELAASAYAYRTKHSISDVRMQIVVKVVAENFDRLDRLITPDMSDVEEPIRREIYRIAKDVVQTVERKDFNIDFQHAVGDSLGREIPAALQDYGLSCEVIHVAQEPTEEIQRYKAICGQSQSFKVEVFPQAERGDNDAVEIEGWIEVTGIDGRDGSWECFERKDYGFYSGSQWNDDRLRQRSREKGIAVEGTGPMAVEERRYLAARIELLDIRDRVVAALQEKLSKKAGLVEESRTEQGSDKLECAVREIGREAIWKEFGLRVDIHGIRRNATGSEGAIHRIRKSKLDLAGRVAEIDVGEEVQVRALVAEQRVADLRDDFQVRQMKRNEVAEGSDPAEALSELDRRINSALANTATALQVTRQSAADLLLQALQKSDGTGTETTMLPRASETAPHNTESR